jgi:hypothetical protein
MRIFGIMALGAALSGCGAQTPIVSSNATEASPKPAKEYLPARQLLAAEKKIIRAAVANNMKDPDSVQIKWTLIRPNVLPDELVTYCVAYNARNSYGGYTGFHPLLVGVIMKGGKATVAQMITTPGHSQDISDGAALQVCRSEGLDPFAAVAGT